MEVFRCQGAKICSPFLSRVAGGDDSEVYYVSAGTGEVFSCSLREGTHVSLVFSGGEPLGAAFDGRGRLLIADCAHAAVLRMDADQEQPGVMVKNYEEKPFRGPSGLAFGDNDALYFTDSGPLGETTLERPRGSLYVVGASPSGGQTLRPLAWESLAHPSGVCASGADPRVLYVAELLANRVLRVAQRPAGTHFLSVFHQFAGAMGPSCVASDSRGQIYVGHYDFADASTRSGRISVLHPDGSLVRTLSIPATEITGLCLSRDESALIVTEASTNAIYRLPL